MIGGCEHLYYDDRTDFILGGDRVFHDVVYIEGFDHYQVGFGTVKGWSANFQSMQTGRFGGQAARITSNNATAVNMPSTYATLIVGFAFKANLSTNGTSRNLCRIRTAANAAVATVFYDSVSQKLQVLNAAGTAVATATTVIVTDTWYYVECKVFVNGASGTCELHVNGVSEIGSTTGNFGSTNIGTLNFAGANSVQAAATTDFDDIYAIDTATGTSPNNTFVGDVRVATSMPSADGAHSQWTPSSGSNHFDRVNELTGTFPDGDTTYVSDATPNDLDSYAVDDIDGGATVFGVRVSLYARKDDAATRQIAPLVRQASTDYAGTTVTLSSSYVYYSQIYANDPTGSHWTASNVNSDEFGVKEIA